MNNLLEQQTKNINKLIAEVNNLQLELNDKIEDNDILQSNINELEDYVTQLEFENTELKNKINE